MSDNLERTGRRIVAGTWGCAAITMAASAANAALTYGALGDNRALGLATGIAVDIGLCVALIGDRRLYTHGLASGWGRALRITTAVMSLVLNVGISLRDGHYFAALLHSFLPLLADRALRVRPGRPASVHRVAAGAGTHRPGRSGGAHRTRQPGPSKPRRPHTRPGGLGWPAAD